MDIVGGSSSDHPHFRAREEHHPPPDLATSDSDPVNGSHASCEDETKGIRGPSKKREADSTSRELLTEYLASMEQTSGRQCTKTWTAGSLAYRCHDCQVTGDRCDPPLPATDIRGEVRLLVSPEFGLLQRAPYGQCGPFVLKIVHSPLQCHLCELFQ